MRSKWGFIFFFQEEAGIRVLVRSRGLGGVYKRKAKEEDEAEGEEKEERGRRRIRISGRRRNRGASGRRRLWGRSCLLYSSDASGELPRFAMWWIRCGLNANITSEGRGTSIMNCYLHDSDAAFSCLSILLSLYCPSLARSRSLFTRSLRVYVCARRGVRACVRVLSLSLSLPFFPYNVLHSFLILIYLYFTSLVRSLSLSTVHFTHSYDSQTH